MNYHILKKDELDGFIKKLSGKMKVVAPVARGAGNFAFQEVSGASEIALKYIPTILPPKKYFMPQRETMLEFDISGAKPSDTAVVDAGETAVFGVHTCDLAGIQCLNMVFSERPRDYNYLRRKDKILLIGLECGDYCDEYASCALVNSHMPSGGYDLFFTDLGDRFIIHVHTQKAEELVEEMGLAKAVPADMTALEKVRAHKRSVFKKEVNVDPRKLPAIFAAGADSKVWKDVGARCVSCGNCTNVCPSCYCFDMADTMNLDLKTGVRTRTWDSCQLEPFAQVAGGENFRKERSERQRHRYFRKFKYSVDKFYRFFCTGCGRCTRTCMADISLKETLTSLVKENV
ncbi:MAG: Ni/Fe hydrogenase subunit beta [Elusimicrobia bacterium GWA2_56_46]|nr:MAG: Ni/Fe hydrogenase subunit beta [Elusimicrobia bacterium GWA2_56_46]OGR55400.1 MAG: Ni/Fe hydrogenase subunit beta [Elusimicrobia bacterium GWC2_56_31]HBB66352.1 Ni/Fe hydrogenase subunit beta [Elusimicrobiota bacterium]HBW21863.1 Ni/Fe hydrogenase subunit beta [Elusimicrobiota bacterium]